MSKFLRIVEDADPTIDSEAKDVIRELFNDAHVADVTYNDRVISVHFKEGGTLKLKYISLSKNEEDNEGQKVVGAALNAVMNAPNPGLMGGLTDPAASKLYKAKKDIADGAQRYVAKLMNAFRKAERI